MSGRTNGFPGIPIKKPKIIGCPTAPSCHWQPQNKVLALKVCFGQMHNSLAVKFPQVIAMLELIGRQTMGFVEHFNMGV